MTNPITPETMKLINDYVAQVSAIPYAELTDDTKVEFSIIMSLMQHHLSRSEGNPLTNHLDKMDKPTPGLEPLFRLVAGEVLGLH